MSDTSISEIRDSVNTLCKLLQCITTTSLKPEHFRLAKLNKLNSDDVQLFWTVLHKLCCSVSSKCKDEVCKCVVAYLNEKTQGVLSFCVNPEASPRQLLLCLGWLLAHEVVEDIIDQILIESFLHEELLVKQRAPCRTAKLTRPSVDDFDAQLQYATFLCGQIRRNLKAIANFQQERVKMFNKIHNMTDQFQGLPHLSTGDAQLLASEEMVSKFLSVYQTCLPVFKAYGRWQKKCHVFWQWMDTVLKDESVDSNPLLLENELISTAKKIEITVQKIVLGKNADSMKLHVNLPTNVLTTRRLHLSKNDNDIHSSTVELLDRQIEEVHNVCKGISKSVLAKRQHNVQESNESLLVDKVITLFSLVTPKIIDYVT